jgi:hypothetical protein
VLPEEERKQVALPRSHGLEGTEGGVIAFEESTEVASETFCSPSDMDPVYLFVSMQRLASDSESIAKQMYHRLNSQRKCRELFVQHNVRLGVDSYMPT